VGLRGLIVTAGGLGRIPFAPGTWGTLPGVAIALLLPGGPWWPFWLGGAFLLVSALNILLCPWAERTSGKKDPSFFVIDEVAGYLVVVAGPEKPTVAAAIVAFFLFRLFDVLKPPPARQAERLPAGWGILLDDVAAGVYGWLVLLAIRAAWVGI
jgi:phosphatidylglycerophosphatase A